MSGYMYLYMYVCLCVYIYILIWICAYIPMFILRNEYIYISSCFAEASHIVKHTLLIKVYQDIKTIELTVVMKTHSVTYFFPASGRVQRAALHVPRNYKSPSVLTLINIKSLCVAPSRRPADLMGACTRSWSWSPDISYQTSAKMLFWYTGVLPPWP